MENKPGAAFVLSLARVYTFKQMIINNAVGRRSHGSRSHCSFTSGYSFGARADVMYELPYKQEVGLV